MTNRTTKSALLMSALALLLCIAMLTGTTFAWFTDEVKSGNNIIKSGNLDIELQYWKDGAWKDVKGQSDILSNELFEPGVVEVAYLRIKNAGSLALKYQLGINIISEIPGVNVDGESFKLSDYIQFGVVGIAADANDVPDTFETRDDAVDAVKGNSKKISAGYTKAAAMAAEAEQYLAVVVGMPPSVGNEANHDGTHVPQIDLGINIFATQFEAEEDSFGKDYDDDAWNKGFKVLSADDLRDALANGEKNIVLMDDIELTESIVIPAASATFAMRSAPAPVVLNLNGKTISNPNGYVIENYGNVVIDGNGTLTGLGVIRSHAGNITIENGNFYASSRWQDGVYQHSLKAENTNVVINGGNFDATVNGQTNAVLNASENAVITINGGSFKNVADALTQFDPYLFTYEKNGKVVINDGTFYGGWRFNGVTATTDIYGGTFTVGFDGQSFNANSTHVVTVYGGTFCTQTHEKLTGKFNEILADGFKTFAIDGTYYVVADNVAGVVTKPDAMKDALANAGAAGAGNTTIAFFGDIDMTGTDWTPIKVDGYHGADIVTIEGNGATITGLTAPLFAGGFAGGSGIVIKDLTIADSNIVSKNTIGSGAFIESVDSMAKIDLINCHLLNSTVTGGAGSRTGGLIGWTAGYNNVNDGPVKTYVTIKDCSVIGCTITCDGSVGGIYGHAGNNAWTYSTVKNCVVKNNVLNSTDDGGWRVGVVVGTANVGELAIEGITESGNKLTQTGKTAPAGQSNLYGRFVPDTTGKLFINGVREVPSSTALADAIANGEKVTLTQDVNLGKIDLTGATADVVIDANGHEIKTTDFYGIEAAPGKNITISNADVVMTRNGDYINYAAGLKIANGDYAGATITLKDCTITMANTDWAYAVTMPASVKNLNLVIDNCTLEGAIAVQCWGDNNTITITNSKLICNYTTSELYTSYCVVLQGNGSYAAENNTLVVDNCEFAYSGVDNFDSPIYSVEDLGAGNTVTVTNCTYGEKVVAG